MKKHHKRARRKLPFLKLCSCMAVDQEDFPDSNRPYSKSEKNSSSTTSPVSPQVSFLNPWVFSGLLLQWERKQKWANCQSSVTICIFNLTHEIYLSTSVIIIIILIVIIIIINGFDIVHYLLYPIFVLYFDIYVSRGCIMWCIIKYGLTESVIYVVIECDLCCIIKYGLTESVIYVVIECDLCRIMKCGLTECDLCCIIKYWLTESVIYAVL